MRFGHRLTGKIEAFDDKGRGVFELHSDKTTVGSGRIAIPFSTTGDEVIATFVKRDHGVKVARIESIVTPGPDRVSTPCPHAGICGGCLWQHLSYDAQRRIKQDMINAAFANAGHNERITEVMPCLVETPTNQHAEKHTAHPSATPFYFRNRMDYAVGWNGEIGLKEYGQWNRYVDLTTCLLLDDNVGETLQLVRDWMHKADLQPWDAKFHTGDIRYVVIRDGKHTNQRMIIVVVKDASRITPAYRSLLTTSLAKLCTSLLIGEQSLPTDISFAQKFDTLIGDPWITEIASNIRYRIYPNSFFQTNTVMAEELQRKVAEFTGIRDHTNSHRILDLYCGLGFFSIFLAKQVSSLHISGFEIDAEAINLAQYNAKMNGVATQCDFTSGPAEDLSWKNIETDCMILDPPRAGLHPKVIKAIIEKHPQTIVYVSCNYHRLVEELKQFKNVYHIESVQAIDLFPHTRHVEVVVKLRYT